MTLHHLKLRTEHSHRFAIGKLSEVLAKVPGTHAAITDRDGTWGHVKWAKACKEAGKVPVFGVELAVVRDADLREKQETNYMTFLAKNDEGLSELYRLVSLATEKFYYIPRIDYEILYGVSENVVKLSGPYPDWERIPSSLKEFYIELGPLSPPDILGHAKYPAVAVSDNLYPTPQHRGVYDIILGQNRSSRTLPSHILTGWEWGELWGHVPRALAQAQIVLESCNAHLGKAELVKPKVKHTLRQMCVAGAKARGIDLKVKKYKERLDRELALIELKKFEDYFFLVADMIAWAKQRMVVGPARGSSCGSLVCYLIGITDIDPMPFDLLFERFIDINRSDIPDIDIDFQDDKRELVIDYLREKYGPANVARLGTVSVYKPKSALGECAKELGIPDWEINDLKNAIVERSSGDSRATFCILDTFEELDIGRQTLAKYPELAVSGEMEGHARHTGMHAAGVIVTSAPVVNYCAINHHTGTAMVDKKDAAALNLLKIDALGLRTLSVIGDCLEQIGWTKEQLNSYPLDDQAAFDVINDSRYAGVFQYEGYALQSLAKQFHMNQFEDIVVITALARPGPMNSGGASSYVKRRNGKEEVTYQHPLLKSVTGITYGVIVYQEQVMQIAREVGKLSWEDVSDLRLAMSRTLGEEYFSRFRANFRKGAGENGLTVEEADLLWDNINTFGSWAFNRSHAVAYGMVSYWCCVLKAHFPLEFAAACLRNAKDDDQSIKILRELIIEGYKYKPYDRELSEANWTAKGDTLIGGLTGIKGVGAKKAEVLLRKRASGTPYTEAEEKLLASGETPWDKVFECAERWAHVLANPSAYGIASRITPLNEIQDDSNGEFVVIAKLTAKVPRDHNEAQSIQKRGGKRMADPTAYLNLTLEDDTSAILANINRFDYAKWAVPIIEKGKVGDWYVWKGTNRGGFRRLYIKRYKKMTGNPEFNPQQKSEKTSSQEVSKKAKSSSPTKKAKTPKPKPSKTCSKK